MGGLSQSTGIILTYTNQTLHCTCPNWGFPELGVPQNGSVTMENPWKSQSNLTWMIWGYPHVWKPPYHCLLKVQIIAFLLNSPPSAPHLWSSRRSRTGRPRPDRGRRRPHLAKSRGGLEGWGSPAKWWFPKIGVSPNHPFLDGIFPWKASIFGYLHLWKLPVVYPWLIPVYRILNWASHHNHQGKVLQVSKLGSSHQELSTYGGLNQESLEFKQNIIARNWGLTPKT